nr:gamma-glutamyl-gamma-aminobutyrate hydrolase family protein [Conexibacter arvalis]
MEGLTLDAYFSAYAEQIRAAGGTPLFLPREADPDDLCAALDAVVLAGGLDVEPRRYGGEPGPNATAHDSDQDEFDIALARAAIARGLPLLGCCRGHQVLNVARGGTLCPDLPADGLIAHNARDRSPRLRDQRVRLAPGSLLRELLGAEERVNTIHHQAIDALGAGLVATAHADDGVVEAVELTGAPVVGVQWHPELHAGADPLFAWLVDAARRGPQRARDHAAVAPTEEEAL